MVTIIRRKGLEKEPGRARQTSLFVGPKLEMDLGDEALRARRAKIGAWARIPADVTTKWV